MSAKSKCYSITIRALIHSLEDESTIIIMFEVNTVCKTPISRVGARQTVINQNVNK